MCIFRCGVPSRRQVSLLRILPRTLPQCTSPFSLENSAFLAVCSVCPDKPTRGQTGVMFAVTADYYRREERNVECWKAPPSVREVAPPYTQPQRHVGCMIFLVHASDDRCVHGPSVTGAANLVTLCASALLILDRESWQLKHMINIK